MFELILYSLIGGLFALVGGLALIWKSELVKRFTLPLLAFAAGSFIGASYLDILPEAIEMVDDPHPLMYSFIIGFVAFFALERFMMRYFHNHEVAAHGHADHTESLPVLLITGDSIHNFIDGLVIGLAYLLDPTLSLVTALAVAAHEIPQEIGDFTILLNQGWSKSRVIWINVLQSLLSVVGAVVAYLIGRQIEFSLPYLLAGAAGIFTYLGASDIIPEVHHLAGHKHAHRVLLIFVSAIVLVGLLTRLAHGE